MPKIKTRSRRRNPDKLKIDRSLLGIVGGQYKREGIVSDLQKELEALTNAKKLFRQIYAQAFQIDGMLEKISPDIFSPPEFSMQALEQDAMNIHLYLKGLKTRIDILKGKLK